MAHIRRALRAAVVAALVTVTASMVPTRATDVIAPPCNTESWVAGTVDLCGGEVTYRDYVYDDYGAATDDFSPRGGPYGYLPTSGDQEYTGEPNTADLVSLRVWIADDELRVAFHLNTLFEPDTTVAALAIDTDNNPATGGGKWGDLDVASQGWDVLHVFDDVDPARNVITGTAPVPPGNRWRLQAVTAQADGTVMNVAFRGVDERGFWWEDLQANALRLGDISGFASEVDVADIRNLVTRRSQTPAGKILQRVYFSRHPVPPGEGIGEVQGRATTPSGVGGQTFNFLGEYQPYGFYLPTEPAPHGVELLLHGYLENHSARLHLPGTNHRITEHIGEARNRILVSPLGRGPAGWYSDWAERDVLDALADAERTYPVDGDRRFISGYSMGGYGTFRLGALYPDRFAGFIAWVGYTGDVFNGVPPFQGRGGSGGAVGNPYEFVGNLRWVPGAMVYGAEDELVHAQTAVFMQREFARQAVPHVWYMHPLADHITFAVTDDWRKESDYTAPLTLVKRPPRVTFRTDPEMGNAALGLAHDRAYWVSAIRSRDPGYADVDATSFACGGALPTTTETQGAGLEPLPWFSLGVDVTGDDPLPTENRLDVSVANVASMVVDARSCLEASDLAYNVATDGPVTIALPDARVLSFSGAGTHKGVLPSGRAAPPVPAPHPAPAPAPDDGAGLPATGAAPPAAAATALLFLFLAIRRCVS